MVKKVSLIIGVALLALTACTPKITGLLHDPSFNTSTLYNGRMIVGGVTMAPALGKMTPEQSDLLAAVLTDRFLKKRKRLTVFPHSEILQVIGRKRHNEILAEFAKTGQLSPASINDLKKTGKARYVVLARIDSDHIAKERTHHAETRDKNGNVVTKAHSVSTVRRTINTTLYVFDTQSAKAVWGGILTTSLSNSKTYYYDNKIMNDIRRLQAITGGLDKALPYPAPPSMRSLCRSAFAGYAKNLPDLK
jgi:hypothetical protein